MNIGILKEDPRRERRVALTPAGAHSCTSAGHQLFLEKNAGEASHFSDEKYEAVGAQIVYSRDEVFGRSDILLKISPPTEADCDQLIDGQTVFSFLHLAISSTKMMELLLRKHICAIGYELIEDSGGNLPILQIMGEIAGQMTTNVAARFLESNHNGRGIVMGGITGIPPATVVIIGAGTVGQAAARMALGTGAEVIVLDKDIARLRALENRFNYRVITSVANEYNIRKALQFADVAIGAVLIKGERAPHVVTEDLVRSMKPGSIIIDVSIDQGGCFATSRPTTLENPTFVLHDVIHYCVPNMAANVARTATYGLTNALLPYLQLIMFKGLDGALREDAGLSRGVCTYHGLCTRGEIARRFELDAFEVATLLR